MKKWYVIQIKYKQEKIAIENLEAQGFEVYYPLTSRLSKTGKELLSPFFSGYMFVAFDIGKDRWRSICGTQGVYKLLTATDKNVTALPKGFIESMIKRTDENGVMRLNVFDAVLKKFEVGQEVEIMEGPFKMYRGTVEQVEKNKISILFSLLGRKNSIKLSHNAVRHADLSPCGSAVATEL